MRHRTAFRQVTFVLLLVAVVFTRDVYAYLDPGTGSLVFQTAVAALAAVAYACRVYWGKIRMLFSRSRSRTPGNPTKRA